MDCYYANARLYDADGVILCMYVLTEQCLSVFPIDGLKGIDHHVDKLFIKFFTVTEDTIYDEQYDYNEFINYVKEFSQPYSDDCLLIPPLDMEEIKNIRRHIKKVEI